ncbi:hypothetical protein [Terricaulis silvestris]|uniref:Uncharacterized protein n=1 Tax=Terricaulis silvestris TaxID=2686094 RepID=A0A6I6MTA9_9CAUL|nr:hypothetical protein [Terricaulis silvestris]QGZ96676.1 hypothetical protein DSM104635_03537 [Terricaulis silvestris]
MTARGIALRNIVLRLIGGWLALFLLMAFYLCGAAIVEVLLMVARGELPWRRALPALDYIAPTVLSSSATWSSFFLIVFIVIVVIASLIGLLLDRFKKVDTSAE